MTVLSFVWVHPYSQISGCDKTNHRANNYLDDFLFGSYLGEKCNELVRKFLDICDQINMLIAIDKTEWATELILFLGVLLDTFNKQKSQAASQVS